MQRENNHQREIIEIEMTARKGLVSKLEEHHRQINYENSRCNTGNKAKKKVKFDINLSVFYKLIFLNPYF